MESITTEPLLDAKDVRKILRCSLPFVYKMADRGQIPSIRIPCPGDKQKRLLRFKKNDVLSFIEKHYENAIQN